ncbi:DegV family protein [Metamycoplasma gateae]|uniref:DegV family protein n=1 Tax=Metamycoplasma gateae TaxID=35769 RepID=A0ABZ2AHM4_9BACT|nr:DegV family protein [Metamycoplasma gateae]
MKVKIIVDSSSGLTEAQANQLGWGFIPLQCQLDGKNYLIGKEIFIKDFAEMWNKNRKMDAATSASSPAINEQVVSQYLEEYDKILIYSISKHLSSQNSFLITQFQDNEKVFIVDSKKLSFLILKDLLTFEEEIKNGIPFEEAIKIFDENNKKLILIPQFNDALVKGGRLSKAAAVVAKLLKIVPLIAFDNGKLEKEGIGRVFTKSLEKTVSEMWSQNKDNIKNKYLFVAHAENQMIDKLIESFRSIINDEIEIYSIDLPVDISVHTGIGAVCVSIVDIDEKIKDKFLHYCKKW